MQHELGDGLDDIQKWSKIAERYGNSEISSGKDISEIKSTLNDLATRLERTQLGAVTPEKKCTIHHSRTDKILYQRTFTNRAYQKLRSHNRPSPKYGNGI